jgi:hypothetical protein
MLWLAASLPDALVGVAPDTDGALRLRLDDRPETAWQALVSPGMEQDRVEDRAEDKVQWRGDFYVIRILRRRAQRDWLCSVRLHAKIDTGKPLPVAVTHDETVRRDKRYPTFE